MTPLFLCETALKELEHSSYWEWLKEMGGLMFTAQFTLYSAYVGVVHLV